MRMVAVAFLAAFLLAASGGNDACGIKVVDE
jgi:hypothetical protein